MWLVTSTPQVVAVLLLRSSAGPPAWITAQATSDRGKDLGGGFFTGYWLTTGAPTTLSNGLYVGDTAPLSNAIFVGGWYSLTTKFSMTSGTSGVHVCPTPSGR